MDEGWDARQSMIEGWDQPKIKQTVFGVVTEPQNLLARNIILMSAALGVGTVEASRLPDEEDLPYEYHIAKKDYGLKLEERLSKYDILVDATNNPEGKWTAAKTCAEKGTPFISVSSSPTQAYYFAFYSKDFSKIKSSLEQHLKTIDEKFASKSQGKFTSLVVGGVALDRARREIFITKIDEENGAASMRKKENNIESLFYNSHSRTRFDNFTDVEELNNEAAYAGKNILLIGAGGIGTYIAKGLLDFGEAQLAIIDDKLIKIHNRNRQLFYFNHTCAKATVLEDKLNSYGKIFAKGYVLKFGEEFKLPESELRPDLIFSAVDNHYTRKLINEFALKHNIPLVDTGSEAASASVRACVPNYTCCLRHDTNVSRATESAQRALGCSDRPDEGVSASVIMTTALAGGLALAEGQILLQKKGQLVPGRLWYDADAPKFTIEQAPYKCSCTFDKKTEAETDRNYDKIFDYLSGKRRGSEG